MNILFWIICGVIGAFVTHLGYEIFSFEWWVICGCVWLSNIVGLIEGTMKIDRSNKC